MSGNWECKNGHVVGDEKAKVCPVCGADVMWSWAAGAPEPSLGPALRGARPPSPWAWIVLGLLVSGFGGAIWLTAETDGPAVTGLLLLLLGVTAHAVGVIAAGVRMGIEAAGHRPSSASQ